MTNLQIGLFIGGAWVVAIAFILAFFRGVTIVNNRS